MKTVAAILKHKGHQVTTIEPTATVAHIVAVLTELSIGSVLVTDRANRLLGIVSERDIMHAIAANGAQTLEMSAGQVMTPTLQVVHPETTVVEAMTMMTISRSRHLPVIDHQALVGLISIGDVVKARLMDQESEVDSLKSYVAGVDRSRTSRAKASLNIPGLATFSDLALIGFRAFFRSFVKYGTRPLFRTSRWRWPSRASRTIGASIVGAMFQVGARFRSGFTVPKILAIASAGRKLA